MRHVILLSCMGEMDHSIIERSNIQSDVIVVNQCNRNSVERFEFEARKGKTYDAIFVNTTDRGLSNSRNMAISYANDDDICQICDDDEMIAENASEIILKAYEEHPKSDIITFVVDRKDKNYPLKSQVLNFIGILRTSSVQITFRKKSIATLDIKFDNMLGSGTGNGAGEEIKFLLDCKKNHLKLLYIPQSIAKLKSYDSKWFKGYNESYFQNFGWSTRRIMGGTIGAPYLIYWLITHKKLYNSEISFWKSFRNIMKGFLEKRK